MLVANIVAILIACYGVLLCLSFFDGWHALGKRFRADPKVLALPARSYLSAPVTVGRVSYRSSIFADKNGLSLRRKFPFSLWFPSLFLPWVALHLLEVRKDIRGRWALLVVSGFRPIRIILPSSLIEEFLSTSNAQSGATTMQPARSKLLFIGVGVVTFVVTLCATLFAMWLLLTG